MDDLIKIKNISLRYQSAQMLSVKKICRKLFGKEESSILNRYEALQNISLTIQKGKVYGVIGNNGAGKSTLLRVLSGVMSPNQGNIERNYKTINLLALGVGFSSELTGMENIYLNGMLLGFTKKQISAVKDEIIEYSELGEFINKPMKTYSSGMISRLGFSIAIHLKPEVLLIDEVLSVGDTKFQLKSSKSIKNIIKNENITVVMVTHSMSVIKELCDYVIWLDKGELIAQGNCEEIVNLYETYNQGKISISELKEKKYIKSEKNKQIFISILGSCVSRDIFEFADSKRFQIEHYFARTSVVSSVSKPIELKEEEIKLSSPFQRRMVLTDLNKSYWKTIRDGISEYVMIDFIDERYETGKLFDSYFTLSKEFKESECIKEYKIINKVKKKDEYFIEEISLNVYLEEFIERVKSMFKEKKIILHKAKLVDYYISNQREIKKFSASHCEYIKKTNLLLDYMYSYVESKLENCICLECTEPYFADEKHKWGLSHMHYEEKYYISVFNSLYNNLLKIEE